MQRLRYIGFAALGGDRQRRQTNRLRPFWKFSKILQG
jgi:hypothetical protein